MNKITMRKLSFFLVLITLITSTSNFASAMPIASANTELFQKQVTSIQENQTLADKEKIELITKTFFTAKEANYKDDLENIDLSFFFSNTNDNRYNINKIMNEFTLEKGIRQGVKAKINSDDLLVTINKLNIENNTATLKVYENYQYKLEGSDTESSRGITYFIEFKKSNGLWLISKMTSDNELENDSMGNENYTVSSVLSNYLSNEQKPLDSKSLAIENAIANDVKLASLYNNAYRRDVAASYATTYSNNSRSTSDTAPYNRNFPNYNPSDCQNFASQCVWYGLGGSNDSKYINNKVLPMVKSGDRAWYQSGTRGDCDGYNRWINCSYFADYVSAGSMNYQGPCGHIYSGNLSYADVGDTIQIYDSRQGWYHTYVVNAVTGQSGSRSNSNIWVCAHTSNRNNERLDTVIGTSQSNTRNVKIYCSYY